MSGTSRIGQVTEVIVRDFEDVDELSATVGFDTRFHQLTDGAQHIQARLRPGREVSLVWMRFNCGFHQRGLPPADTVTLGVPITGMQDWCARSFTNGDWPSFNSEAGVDGVSRPGFAGFTLSLQRAFLERTAAELDLPIPAELVLPRTGGVIRSSDRTRGLEARIQRLLFDASSPLDSDCETSIAIDILEAGVGREDEIVALPAARSRAITEALAYLEAHADENVNVGQLCAETGVAWRTLDRAFRERFEMGPKTYAKRERLLRVRSALLRSAPSSAIVDAANAAGFWHMGQFARDYRQFFGELPYATLRR